MNEHEYDEVLELAEFCLVTGTPWVQAIEMPDPVRAAFYAKYQELRKKNII